MQRSRCLLDPLRCLPVDHRRRNRRRERLRQLGFLYVTRATKPSARIDRFVVTTAHARCIKRKWALFQSDNVPPPPHPTPPPNEEPRLSHAHRKR